MSNRISRRGVNAGIGAAPDFTRNRQPRAFAQGGGEPIKIGFGMALTGPLARQRPTGTARRHNLVPRKSTPRAVSSAAKFSSSIMTISPIHRMCRASIQSCSMSTKPTLSLAVMRPTWLPRPFRSSCKRARFSSACSRSMQTPSSSIRRYFSIIPTGGPNPKQTITEGFFQVAAAQNPKPKTVAMRPKMPSSRAMPLKA